MVWSNKFYKNPCIFSLLQGFFVIYSICSNKKIQKEGEQNIASIYIS